MEFIALTETKTNLSAVIDQVNASNEPVIITRHGRPAAAIISITDLDRLVGPIRITHTTENTTKETP